MGFQMILTVDILDPETGKLLEDDDVISSAWFRKRREGLPPGIADVFGQGLGATLFPVTFLNDKGEPIDVSVSVRQYATQVVIRRWSDVPFADKGVVDLYATDSDDFVLEEL